MTRAAAATVYLASVVTILAAAVCSAAAAPSPLGQYDASELEEVRGEERSATDMHHKGWGGIGPLKLPS